jgi:hypothetical protein
MVRLQVRGVKDDSISDAVADQAAPSAEKPAQMKRRRGIVSKVG